MFSIISLSILVDAAVACSLVVYGDSISPWYNVGLD